MEGCFLLIGRLPPEPTIPEFHIKQPIRDTGAATVRNPLPESRIAAEKQEQEENQEAHISVNPKRLAQGGKRSHESDWKIVKEELKRFGTRTWKA